MPQERIKSAAREIGRRIRTARTGAGSRLSDLAARTNLTEGFLSKLERGHASTSIANLIRIADALGLGLHELFEEGQSAPARTAVAVYRAESGAAPLLEVESTGYRWRYLAGGAPLDRMEVFHLVFPLKDRMNAMVSHPGQEHCFVLSGEILFHVGGRQQRLCAGEGIFIDSELPHRAENVGEIEAHVLMTVVKTADLSMSPDWWRLPTVRPAEEMT